MKFFDNFGAAEKVGFTAIVAVAVILCILIVAVNYSSAVVELEHVKAGEHKTYKILQGYMYSEWEKQ